MENSSCSPTLFSKTKLMQKKFLILSFGLILSGFARSQDTTDLMKSLEQSSMRRDYTIATFKATRLINGNTVENLGKGVLDARISHRFGRVNGGFKELFGLDNATARIGVDYGFTDRLMAGIGRSSFEKTLDAFFKWKIFRQSSGERSFPFTINYAAGLAWTTLDNDVTESPAFQDEYRLSYYHQLIIGKKFSDKTSLLIAPTLIHRNLVPLDSDPNNLFSIGIGGRQKITRRMSFTFEYYYQLDDAKIEGSKNSLSLGLDIETGGHVFQLHFTNAQGINERSFITGTTGDWGDGDVHFGFNISRVFSIGKRNSSNY